MQEESAEEGSKRAIGKATEAEARRADFIIEKAEDTYLCGGGCRGKAAAKI